MLTKLCDAGLHKLDRGFESSASLSERSRVCLWRLREYNIILLFLTRSLTYTTGSGGPWPKPQRNHTGKGFGKHKHVKALTKQTEGLPFQVTDAVFMYSQSEIPCGIHSPSWRISSSPSCHVLAGKARWPQGCCKVRQPSTAPNPANGLRTGAKSPAPVPGRACTTGSTRK